MPSHPSVRAIALGLALFLGSCGAPVAESPSDTSSATTAPSSVAAKTDTAIAQSPDPAAKTTPETAPADKENVVEPYPEIGELIELQPGDLKCYATVRDPQGQVFDIGATFEVCDRQDELLNQTVRLVYSEENVADCPSNEPCGRSVRETLISDGIPLGEAWQVLSNGAWTVTVGRIESWDGTNNTGNMTYYGCDDTGSCLSLTEGFTVCRNGVCNMSWANGDYAYTLSSEMSETAGGTSTLLVWQNGTEILRAENMEIIDSSDF